jgi:hypothetical protein
MASVSFELTDELGDEILAEPEQIAQRFARVKLAESMTGKELDQAKRKMLKWIRSFPEIDHQRLAEAITVEKAEFCSCMRASLHTLYETRHFEPGIRKLPEDFVYASHVAEGKSDLWDFASPLPDAFEAAREAIDTKGGERVLQCRTCHGSGQQTCQDCEGQSDDDDCEACDGQGQVPCRTCKGQGRVLQVRVLTCEREPAFEACDRISDYLNEDVRRDSNIERDGETVASLSADQLDPSMFRAIEDENVRDAVQSLISNVTAPGTSKCRIVRQRLDVSMTPVVQMTYVYQGQRYEVAFVGRQNRAVASQTPFWQSARKLLKEASNCLEQGTVHRGLRRLQRAMSLGDDQVVTGARALADRFRLRLSDALRAVAEQSLSRWQWPEAYVDARRARQLAPRYGTTDELLAIVNKRYAFAQWGVVTLLAIVLFATSYFPATIAAGACLLCGLLPIKRLCQQAETTNHLVMVLMGLGAGAGVLTLLLAVIGNTVANSFADQVPAAHWGFTIAGAGVGVALSYLATRVVESLLKQQPEEDLPSADDQSKEGIGTLAQWLETEWTEDLGTAYQQQSNLADYEATAEQWRHAATDQQ